MKSLLEWLVPKEVVRGFWSWVYQHSEKLLGMTARLLRWTVSDGLPVILLAAILVLVCRGVPWMMDRIDVQIDGLRTSNVQSIERVAESMERVADSFDADQQRDEADRERNERMIDELMRRHGYVAD